MTIDDFWKKYNRCPMCEHYAKGQRVCVDCWFRDPYAEKNKNGSEHFRPNERCVIVLNREVTEL